MAQVRKKSNGSDKNLLDNIMDFLEAAFHKAPLQQCNTSINLQKVQHDLSTVSLIALDKIN